MLLARNIKIATASLRASKWRSLLTMLGVIIGVSSVVTIVSIGEGVRTQVTSQINELGENLVTVRPGQLLQRDSEGNVTGVSLFSAAITTALGENDWIAVRDSKGVGASSPFNVVSGSAIVDETSLPGGLVIGVSSDLPQVLNTEVQFGEFFRTVDTERNVAVIGKSVAEQLFQEIAPTGKSLIIRGERFIVRGIFDEFPTSPLTVTTNTNYNSAIFIPYEASKRLNDGQAQIYQILAKASMGTSGHDIAASINERLLSLHDDQQSFTVLEQEENLAVANTVLTLLTGLISGVAAISLLVGGIGIMNIMLVSVTERTREIGIRKSIGATNQQILSQFLTEAMMLSFIGGLLGVVVSIFANYLLRIFTDLQPVITLSIVFISVGVALAVGIVFGVAPALRAARKDPILALRND
jgi:ABC-type antimicrobial peptide transport system permease subunit